MKNSNITIIIFFTFFLVRFFFLAFAGFNNFELQFDSTWYNAQSDQVLKGNFNLLRPLFITAPFFTYFQALIKFTFSNYWMIALEFLQITIASVAGVFFYRLSDTIFDDKQTNILSTFFFCFYPLTLWWVGTFTQDIWFQSFLIIFFYYFLQSLKNNSFKLIIISSIFFSITFLTKSHILLFSLFIPVIIFLQKKISFIRKLKFVIIFIMICITFTLPYGIYNLIVNKTYTVSSGGIGGSFLIGNNSDAYLNHVKLNEITPEQKERFRWSMHQIFEELKPKIQNVTPSEIQKIYLYEGFKWIKENPKHAIELKVNHAIRFFTPGINKYWYSYEKWLAALIITAPLYFFAFVSILYLLFKSFKQHFWILALMMSMFLFTIIFYFSNRFLIITLYPYYIIFASYFIVKLKSYYTKLN
jgi:hypothetical protein